MQISKYGLEFIKNLEGVVPCAYLCPAKKLTIGIGHLCKPNDGYLFGKRIEDLRDDILKNGKKFKKGYITKNGRKIFFYIPTSKNVMEITQITNYHITYLLKKDIQEYIDCINDIGKILTQNQFDSLVCFCYNIGKTAFKRSELFRKLKLGNFELKDEFLKWNKITDHKTKQKLVSKILVKRRLLEWELFNK